MRPLIVGLSWLLAPAAKRLDRALAHPARADEVLRGRLAGVCASTSFGRHCGLDGTAESLNRAEPTRWETVAPFAQRERGGEVGALCPGGATAWEVTSGSGGTSKPVPYNRAMLGVFRRMFSAWAHDLIRQGPRLQTGRFYFSISPPSLSPPSLASSAERAPEQALQTLDDDADYLSGWQRALLGPFFVRPPRLAPGATGDVFKTETCLALLAAERLEIVSIWSPSFFAVLLEHLADHQDQLLDALRQRGHRRRATQLQQLGEGPWSPEALWPHLKILSCWTDASAGPAADRLAARLPHAFLQGKGLLATEAPITIPRVELDRQHLGQVPLLSDVLIELEDERGEIRPLHLAEQGHHYRVLVTTPAGLIRYRLGDVVEVKGQLAATPLLRLVGRADAVCDLVGEKLAEAHVDAVLRRIVPEGFRALVPELGSPSRYVVLTSGQQEDPAGLAASLDEALSEAFHYRQARLLGQLGHPRVIADVNAEARLMEAWQRSGRKAGDLKPSALVRVPLHL